MINLYRKFKAVSRYRQLRALIDQVAGLIDAGCCLPDGTCTAVDALQSACRQKGFPFWEEEFGESVGLQAYLEHHPALMRNAQGCPCFGKTLLNLLTAALQRFANQQELFQTLEADQCLDGVAKNPSVCQQAWRGEVCKLCPMHDE